MGDPFNVEALETLTITKAMAQGLGLGPFSPGDLEERLEAFREACFVRGATMVGFSQDAMRGCLRVTVGGPRLVIEGLKALES